jgi:hypothetical protein
MYLILKEAKLMSSLFEDGGCGCGGKRREAAAETKCKGCVCQILNQLANETPADICEIGNRQRLLIKQKGTSTPVSLDGTGTPTVFTLERFDPETCCAVFSFEMMTGTTPTTMVRRTFIEDCRSIAGIVCLGTSSNTTAMV